MCGLLSASVLLAGCSGYSSGGSHGAVVSAGEAFNRGEPDQVVGGGALVTVRAGSPREVWASALASALGSGKVYSERPFVMVEGDVAVLWAEYELDGRRGMDVLTLVRTDDGWRVAGGVSSVE